MSGVTRSKIYRCDSDGAAMAAIDMHFLIIKCTDFYLSRYLDGQTFKCPNI